MGIAAGLYVCVFFVLRLRLYDGLYIGLWDQGFIQQSLYNTLHGRPLEISMSHEGYTHLFAEHFFLFALALLPFYALVPHPATLFLLESLAAAAGGVALYLVAHRRLGQARPALALTVAYLFHPTLQWGNLGLVWYGFHLENFFPPLFLLAVAAMDARRPRLAAGLFFLCLTVAEIFAIPVALYGLLRAVRHLEDRRLGLTMVVAAAVWFLLATLVIIPLFRGGGAPRQFSGISLLLDLVRQPGGLAGYLSHNGGLALDYAAFLLWPFGFLSLAGPLPLLAAVPSVLLNFLGPLVGNELPVRPQAWYAAAVLPLVALAAVDGVDRLGRAASRFGWRQHAGLALPMLLLTSAGAASIAESPLPFSRAEYIEPRWLYYVDDRARAVQEVATLIPEEASVSAEFFTGSHLLNRRHLFWFPKGSKDADYIALDLQSRFPLQPREIELAAELRSSPDFAVLYDQDGFLLLQRRAASRPVMP